MVTILGGLGAVFVLGAMFLFFLLIVGGVIFAIVKRSKDKGVVFRDGISNDEAKLVLEAANEVLMADKTQEVLQKFSSALSRATASKAPGKTPPVV